MCLMDREVDVCDKCYRNCMLFHQAKHDHSPDSFFKIMYGKKFSEVLITPPIFSRTFASLAGKKSFLEDYRGQKWEVAFSVVNGTLAIQKGWRKFYVDHNIKHGDLLVFHYITESYFIVSIWGTSGCPKTFPAEKSNQNKRPKTTENSFTRRFSDGFHEEREPAPGNDCCNAFDVPQLNTNILPRQDDANHVDMSPRVAVNVESKEKNIERPQLVRDVYQEPYFLSDREPSGPKEDDREHRLNLFTLELPDLKPSINKVGNRENKSDMSAPKMINKNLDAREDNREYLRNQPTYEFPNVVLSSGQSEGDHLSDVSTSKMTEKILEADHIGELEFQKSTCAQVSDALCKAHDATDTKKGPLIKGQRNNVVPSNKTVTNLSKSRSSSTTIRSPSLGVPLNPKIPLKNIRKSDTFEPSAAFGYCQPPGETKRILKQEVSEFEENLFGRNYGDGVNKNPMEVDVKIANIVKSEPVDFCDSAPAPFIRVTCLVPPDNESFLELPEPLPMNGRKSKLSQKLIFLRNQAGKDWPVIYHNRYNLKVLASGWDAFKKANNICPGDECGFVVDNIEKGIFRVRILNH